ncbi:jg15515 [Pararge aegeria aegeria]|uniref:Jg15515 protein n=1 Tax=Pararge aegeria aegeria TaxID=348720 RepID=A0A8S4SEZ4_9NEOP|nr:jg15515 [Pararge aegeria aegeria]
MAALKGAKRIAPHKGGRVPLSRLSGFVVWSGVEWSGAKWHGTTEHMYALSGGVMFSPLGRLRVAQAVRKQVRKVYYMISQIPVLASEAAPLQAPLCYQLICPPLAPQLTCAPCEIPPPPYAVYPLPFDTTPTIYAPPTQYALLPAPYSTACCEPSCCAPLDKQPRIPAPPLHPAFIY